MVRDPGMRIFKKVSLLCLYIFLIILVTITIMVSGLYTITIMAVETPGVSVKTLEIDSLGSGPAEYGGLNDRD